MLDQAMWLLQGGVVCHSLRISRLSPVSDEESKYGPRKSRINSVWDGTWEENYIKDSSPALGDAMPKLDHPVLPRIIPQNQRTASLSK
jgi:hypothetical protein